MNHLSDKVYKAFIRSTTERQTTPSKKGKKNGTSSKKIPDGQEAYEMMFIIND